MSKFVNCEKVQKNAPQKICLNPSYISWGKLVFDNKGRKLLNISFNFQLFSLMIKDVSQMNAQFRKASKTKSFGILIFVHETFLWTLKSCGKCKFVQIWFEIAFDPMVSPV